MIASILLVFAMSLLVILHSFIGYPLSLYLLTIFSIKNNDEISEEKSVEIIIAAYNEEDIIADKIENSLSLEYPSDKFTITVFSDASSDGTDNIVESYTDEGVTLRRIEGRVGKTECQNITTAESDADIIVYSDANSMYEPDAIKNLIRRFDSDVDCVVGELRYRKKNNVESESVYWLMERLTKKLEGQVGSVVGGNGSIYAVRRSAYVPLPRGAISDFAEPLEVVRNGGRVAYASDALAWENTNQTVSEEQSRRERIVIRAWNSLAQYPDLLNPLRHPLFSYQLWSHTVLRWLTPVFLGIAAISAAFLTVINPVVFGVLLVTQIALYIIAGLGWVLESRNIETPTIIQVPYYFTSLNVSLLKSLVAFVSGKNVVTWETVDRK